LSAHADSLPFQSHLFAGLSDKLLAGVIKLDPPEISTEDVETTSHDSGGVKTFISGKVSEVSKFKATLSFNPAVADAFVGYTVSGTILPWQIGFPNTETWTFQAFVDGFKPSSADAQKPGELTAEISFRPTGAITIVG
jgi:hypothetical protein